MSDAATYCNENDNLLFCGTATDEGAAILQAEEKLGMWMGTGANSTLFFDLVTGPVRLIWPRPPENGLAGSFYFEKVVDE